ncbi:MAG TPA: hypothetical protein VF485_04560 [Sphingomonas sp.]
MLSFAIALLCVACGPVPQPNSIRTVAAFEIPLPTAADHAAFLQLLRSEAAATGYHVDAADADELQRMSEVSPITLNATIWRGANDDEIVASAMDSKYNLGRVWLSFAKGEDPERFARFRKRLMAKIVRRWPRTASLPILPNGAIPLADDLTRTPSGYRLKATARSKYR